MCRVKVESCLFEVRVLVWGIQSILEQMGSYKWGYVQDRCKHLNP